MAEDEWDIFDFLILLVVSLRPFLAIVRRPTVSSTPRITLLFRSVWLKLMRLLVESLETCSIMLSAVLLDAWYVTFTLN